MEQELEFRDDDIGFTYTAHPGEPEMNQTLLFNKFKEVDKLFIKYKVRHHIAVIIKDFEKAKEWIKYIKTHPHIVPQLHCWEHVDHVLHKEDCKERLIKGIEGFEKIFGFKPTIFYPPYNKIDDFVIEVANELGLETSYDKMSLSGYLRGHQKKVINFHFWSDECNILEEALIKSLSK